MAPRTRRITGAEGNSDGSSVSHIASLSLNQFAKLAQPRALTNASATAWVASVRSAATPPRHSISPAMARQWFTNVLGPPPRRTSSASTTSKLFPTAWPSGSLMLEMRAHLPSRSLPYTHHIDSQRTCLLKGSHEGATANFDIQHDSIRTSSDLLAHDRAHNER